MEHDIETGRTARAIPGPMVCRYEHFLSDWYSRQAKTLNFDPAVTEAPHSYRKLWEWAAITEVLDAAGLLRPGRKGLGFAVGTEVLPAVFAARGPNILATDLAHGGAWAESGQHAANLEALFFPEHISSDDFHSRVSFQHADMNNIEDFPSEEFDFVWSSCAIEHVGSLEQAMQFVKNSMRLLRPGGISVHTTEYNCSSNEQTVEVGENVIFRRKDIERLGDELRFQRCGMKRPDFECGVHPFDLDFDEPPYFQAGRKHIKLLIDGFVSTSFLIVAHKG